MFAFVLPQPFNSPGVWLILAAAFALTCIPLFGDKPEKPKS